MAGEEQWGREFSENLRRLGVFVDEFWKLPVVSSVWKKEKKRQVVGQFLTVFEKVLEKYDVILLSESCFLDRIWDDFLDFVEWLKQVHGKQVAIYFEKSVYFKELQALQMGVLDCQHQKKPFPLLAYRLVNALNQVYGIPKGERFYSNEFIIEEPLQKVYWNGSDLCLTGKEYLVFTYMLSWPERLIAKKEFLDNIWGPDFTGTERVLDTIVKQLRRKIADSPMEIVTKYGKGYGIRRRETSNF